jgi:hypothetical protein
MPFHSEDGTFTTQQIADLGGAAGVHATLIARAFSKRQRQNPGRQFHERPVIQSRM